VTAEARYYVTAAYRHHRALATRRAVVQGIAAVLAVGAWCAVSWVLLVLYPLVYVAILGGLYGVCVWRAHVAQEAARNATVRQWAFARVVKFGGRR